MGKGRKRKFEMDIEQINEQRQLKENKKMATLGKPLNTLERKILDMERDLRRSLDEDLRRGDITMDEARRIWEEQNVKFRQQDMRQMYNSPAWENPSSFAEGIMGIDPARKEKPVGRRELEKAKEVIEKQNEILERIKEDALIMHRIERVSKDGKHTYVSKNGTDLRVKAPEGLKVGHEVLLHPKTMQIVEDLGFPPLEASQFSPANPPKITWDDIGGLEEAKKDMIEAIELPHKEKDLFKFYNKRQVKGILLSGAPGCGKTMLGKAAANSLAGIYGAESARTGFLYVKAPEILNQYVGQTEQTIRDIFIDANRHHMENGYPAVIFIDEADAVLATRGTRNVGIGNTIVPAFLTEMDGLEESTAIVILATNRPDILDPAIVREGRIDRKIEIVRPSLENAITIAKLNLSKFPVAEDYELDVLAEGLATELFNPERYVSEGKQLCDIVSGAMIATCADMAVSAAIHRDIADKTQTGITGDDIIYAVDRIQSQNRNLKHDFE